MFIWITMSNDANIFYAFYIVDEYYYVCDVHGRIISFRIENLILVNHYLSHTHTHFPAQLKWMVQVFCVLCHTKWNQLLCQMSILQHQSIIFRVSMAENESIITQYPIRFNWYLRITLTREGFRQVNSDIAIVVFQAICSVARRTVEVRGNTWNVLKKTKVGNKPIAYRYC